MEGRCEDLGHRIQTYRMTRPRGLCELELIKPEGMKGRSILAKELFSEYLRKTPAPIREKRKSFLRPLNLQVILAAQLN